MSKNKGIYLFEIINLIKINFNYLLKKWLIIVLISGFGASIGLIIAYKSKPKYASSLSFVIEGESLGGLSSIASSFGLSGLGGGKGEGVFNSDNILDLLISRKLVQKTLLKPTPLNKNKSFADLYIEFKEWKEDLEKANEKKAKKLKIKKISKIEFKPNSKVLTLEQNEILNTIYGTLLTEEELKIEVKNPENSIIYIDINTTDHEFSRYFSIALIDVVSEFYIESKTRKAKLNYQIIKKQTDSVRVELNNSISGVAAARDNTFLLNPAFNVKRVTSTQKEVNVQANTIILGELVKNLELSRINLLNKTPILEIIDTPISPLEKEGFGKVKGILIGGFLSGFLIVGFLLVLKFWKSIMTEYKESQENNVSN